MSFNKCFVPGCTTGCNISSKNTKNDSEPVRTLFKTPNNKDLFEKWKLNIPRGGVDLLPGCLVCEIHFPEEYIVRYVETRMADGTVCMTKKRKPALKPGAVPTIFPNLPPHLYRTLKRVALPNSTSTIPKVQKNCSSQTIDSNNISNGETELILKSTSDKMINGSTFDITNDNEVTSSENDTMPDFIESQPKPSPENNVSSSTQDHLFKDFSSISPVRPTELSSNKLKESCEINNSLNNNIMKSTLSKGNQKQKSRKKRNKHTVAVLPKPNSPRRTVSRPRRSIAQKQYSAPDITDNFQIIIAEGENSDSVNSNDTFTFIHLKDNIEDVKVPSWHWSCSFLRNSIAFLDWGQQYDVRKTVIVNYDMKYKVFIKDKEIIIEGFKEPKSFQDLQTFLLIIDKITICQGIERGEDKLWSKNCFGFVPPREEGVKKNMKKRCDECIKDLKNAPSVQKRDEEKQLRRLQRLTGSLNAEKIRNKGLTMMIQKFRQRVEKLSSQLRILKDKNRSLKMLEFRKNMETILTEDTVDQDGNVEEGTTEAIVEEFIVNMDDELYVA